jgi:serine/threonine protein kinase
MHIPTEHIMGTQVYMVPECIRGELSMKVDIFAFGFVVLETLSGSAVYEGRFLFSTDSSLPLP